MTPEQISKAKAIIEEIDDPFEYYETLVALSEGYLFEVTKGNEEKAESLLKLQSFLYEQAARKGYSEHEIDRRAALS
ncbi:hypothetical protein [Planococcus lenghuensis]|uniref:Uncharacterized protein n=1 Tax=Planococcus lenghuensis TaxID=2213202 RepID=A0A1Q2KYV0_9BACL|nr:hypothetical protein [Planococcus lenghuensis]AQQ53390.1 hypothetical protein B0X71_10110 [Planococcus lenghuensis]